MLDLHTYNFVSQVSSEISAANLT